MREGGESVIVQLRRGYPGDVLESQLVESVRQLSQSEEVNKKVCLFISKMGQLRISKWMFELIKSRGKSRFLFLRLLCQVGVKVK